MVELNAGDTAWVLASAALVLLMTPGLAFFYGGMVRSKSVLNMMMMSFVSTGVVSILWVLFGYSVAFGNNGNGFWGGLDEAGLNDAIGRIAQNGGDYPIPMLLFAAFQLMFAVITVALISGAVADRVKFLGWTVFAAIWATIVYFPVAHWVFDFGGAADEAAPAPGWLAERGVLDFAGGTAVHINAGAAGLALCLVVGRRVGWPRTPMKPHNLPLVMIGAGLLWFGWFGCNAGSALGASDTAALAFFNTMVCAASALLGWLFVERIRDGHATSLGAASGAVAGLVAITPACAFVDPWAAIVIGVAVGAICALAVGLKYALRFDDSLDVVAVHLVGGILGSLSIGLLANTDLDENGTNDGLLFGGGWSLIGDQLVGVLSVLAYSFVLTLLIAFVLHKTIGLRISEEQEVEGIDLVQHSETGYDLVGGAGGGLGGRTGTVSGNKAEVRA